MKIFKFLLLFINLSLMGGQFFLANSLSFAGNRLDSLDTQLRDVGEQNRQFESLIYTYSSIEYVRSRAAAAGLVSLELTPGTPLAIAKLQ